MTAQTAHTTTGTTTKEAGMEINYRLTSWAKVVTGTGRPAQPTGIYLTGQTSLTIGSIGRKRLAARATHRVPSGRRTGKRDKFGVHGKTLRSHRSHHRKIQQS